MNVLFLINAAQEHRTFYSKVAAELLRRGIDVQYAVDSHYTDFVHPDAPLGDRAHYFSDYLRANLARRTLPAELADANVWTAFFPDTDRMMHTRFMRRSDPTYYGAVVANLGHFFTELFDRFGFDSVVYENVSNALSYVAYEVSSRRNARYIGFAASRMPGRLDVLDRATARDSRLEATFHALRTGRQRMSSEVRAYVEDYLRNLNEKVPDYLRNPNPLEMNFLARYRGRNSFQRFYRSWKYAATRPDDAYYAFQAANLFAVFPEQIAREAWRQAKRKLLDAKVYRREVDLESPFFVYPLQFHPESSASVDGVAANDEWSNIEQIARNLPFGVSLYVKDHRHAAGRQPLGFYERVARIPNVVLVHPNYDTKKLLRHSRAVVCSTSTMGFEALLLQRPVFVLGRPFYDFLPGCVRVDSFATAFRTFRSYASLSVDRPDVEALLGAYYLCSEEGTLDVTKQYNDPAAIRWIADIIERKTREHRSGAHRASEAVIDG
jgi:hypothetical protein